MPLKVGSEDAENAGFKGWSEMSKAMRSYDEALVKRWNEEIDTLLVFAGLFSAVLTAFSLETYKLLKEDSQDRTADLLQAVAWQLGNFSADTSTFPRTTEPSQFNISSSSLRVNTYWLISLVLSLSSALLGILAKQWLREYLNWGLTSPRDSVRMRQFRYEGLVSWRVSDIVATLPLLLQMSLVLFLVGLIDLLWSINVVIASCITVIVSLTLLVAFISVILPFFSASCPYKSPLALHVYRLLNSLSTVPLRRLIPYGEFSNSDGFEYDVKYYSWWEHDLNAVQHQAQRATENVDHQALEWSFKTLLDDDFQDLVSHCVSDLAQGTKAQFVFATLARHANMLPHILLDMTRQRYEDASDALQRSLLRAGRRTTARLITLVLDVIPDALPDYRRVRSMSGTALSGDRFSLLSALPGIAVDVTALRRSDLIALLYPLLSAFNATTRRSPVTDGALRGALSRRVLDVLIDIVHAPTQPAVTQAAALNILSGFAPLFRGYITHEDIIKLIAAALHGLAPTSADAPLPKTRANIRYSDLASSFSSASSVALHYICALRVEALAIPELRSRIQDLLRAMRQHVNACNRSHKRYAEGSDQKILWCWDLFWLARKDISLSDTQLVHALAFSDHIGQITTNEKSGLAKLQTLLGLQTYGANLLEQATPSISLKVPIMAEERHWEVFSQKSHHSTRDTSPSRLSLAHPTSSHTSPPFVEGVVRVSTPEPLLSEDDDMQDKLALDCHTSGRASPATSSRSSAVDGIEVHAPSVPSSQLPTAIPAHNVARPAGSHPKRKDRQRGDFVCSYPECRKSYFRYVDLQAHMRVHYPAITVPPMARLPPSHSTLTRPLVPRSRTVDISPDQREPQEESDTMRRRTIDIVPPTDDQEPGWWKPPLLSERIKHPGTRPMGPRPTQTPPVRGRPNSSTHYTPADG